MTNSTPAAKAASAADAFFPSGLFAKVPQEALSFLAHGGSSAMSHAEFRVFVALCRFRGPTRIVNPTRARLEKMTGMTPNNISRATKSLQENGWLTVHYADGNKSRVIENYELCVPVIKEKLPQTGDTASKVPFTTPSHVGAIGTPKLERERCLDELEQDTPSMNDLESDIGGDFWNGL